MRVSKEKAADNRDALLRAASRLFRERGIDGVGVAEVAKAAGLTHGALYAHFPSKEALAAQAFLQGFADVEAGIEVWAGDRRPSFDAYLDALFSTAARDKLATGCPMAASASEIGRQGRDVSASFAEAFEEMIAILETPIGTGMPAARRRRLAIAAFAAQIGAIAVARAVAKADAALSDEVLQATREAIGLACKGKQKPSGPR